MVAGIPIQTVGFLLLSPIRSRWKMVCGTTKVGGTEESSRAVSRGVRLACKAQVTGNGPGLVNSSQGPRALARARNMPFRPPV